MIKDLNLYIGSFKYKYCIINFLKIQSENGKAASL